MSPFVAKTIERISLAPTGNMKFSEIRYQANILAAVSCFLWASTVIAQIEPTFPYWVDSSGSPIRDSSNHCWRTGFWQNDSATLSCDPDAFARNHILPLDSVIAGQAATQWIERYWEWQLSILLGDPNRPSYRDPWMNGCNALQNGPVWFLGSGSGSGWRHRHCDVPSGKYLLVSLSSWGEFSSSSVNGSCDSNRASAQKHSDDIVSLEATINDIPIPILPLYRFKPFSCRTFTILHGTSLEKDIHNFFHDGYWLLISPLPKGRYYLSFSSKLLKDGTSLRVDNVLEVQ